jgi:hypothetical protein
VTAVVPVPAASLYFCQLSFRFSVPTSSSLCVLRVNSESLSASLQLHVKSKRPNAAAQKTFRKKQFAP